MMTESIRWDLLRCRAGCDPKRHPVVGIYFLPHGCATCPDHLQPLCLQHSFKRDALDGMTPIVTRLEHDSMQTDSVVEAVRADLLQRSKAGLIKYGTTLDRVDLDLRAWLQHAYEETLDLANYLKRATMELDAAQDDDLGS
jgi:hypothetical protein